MRQKKTIIKIPQEDLVALHVFTKISGFSVAVAAYNEQQKTKIQYLIGLVQDKAICGTYDLCIWCIHQGRKYQILFPLSILQLISNPIRAYDYIKLKRRLNVIAIKNK